MLHAGLDLSRKKVDVCLVCEPNQQRLITTNPS